MAKIYKVQMNSKGMPNFSTAVEVADRPQGEWEYNNGDLLGYAPFHKCGVCGSEMYTTKDTFCPNCGARMKGADDENKD